MQLALKITEDTYDVYASIATQNDDPALSPDHIIGNYVLIDPTDFRDNWTWMAPWTFDKTWKFKHPIDDPSAFMPVVPIGQ